MVLFRTAVVRHLGGFRQPFPEPKTTPCTSTLHEIIGSGVSGNVVAGYVSTTRTVRETRDCCCARRSTSYTRNVGVSEARSSPNELCVAPPAREVYRNFGELLVSRSENRCAPTNGGRPSLHSPAPRSCRTIRPGDPSMLAEKASPMGAWLQARDAQGDRLSSQRRCHRFAALLPKCSQPVG